MARSIVDIKNMGDALRNTGYKNIESAVSEIIDNSVEAEAKNIFIILDETINPISGRKLVSEIAFLDNGVGMDTNILEGCLGIGSTTRQARKGMGRFGVGLPQASLYACPEVEVYSWQNGIDNCQKYQHAVIAHHCFIYHPWPHDRSRSKKWKKIQHCRNQCNQNCKS